MTAAAAALFGVAAVLAVGDWLSVAANTVRPRWLFKPGAIVALIAAAAAAHPNSPGEREWVIAGLGGGLVGDVLLLLPERPYFLIGLTAFLLGHLAYIVAFRFLSFSPAGAGLGLLTVGGAAALWLGPVLNGLRRSGRQRLVGPAIGYLVVIAAMTVSAFGTGRWLAAAGGLLFFASDILLALTRFARPYRWGRPLDIVLYHLGQGLLAVSLVIPG